MPCGPAAPCRPLQTSPLFPSPPPLSAVCKLRPIPFSPGCCDPHPTPRKPQSPAEPHAARRAASPAPQARGAGLRPAAAPPAPPPPPHRIPRGPHPASLFQKAGRRQRFRLSRLPQPNRPCPRMPCPPPLRPPLRGRRRRAGAALPRRRRRPCHAHL